MKSGETWFCCSAFQLSIALNNQPNFCAWKAFLLVKFLQH